MTRRSATDTDLIPAVEMAFYRTGPRIEIAAWPGRKPLWFPRQMKIERRLPWCHFLSKEDFEESRDHTDHLA